MFCENEKLRFISLIDASGFDYISEVRRVSIQKQDRRRGRMNNIESDTPGLKDMLTNCLTKSVNMSPGGDMADRTKMIGDLQEIGN